MRRTVAAPPSSWPPPALTSRHRWPPRPRRRPPPTRRRRGRRQPGSPTRSPDGLVPTAQFGVDDYGLSIDVAFGLDAAAATTPTVGGDHATASRANVDSYTGVRLRPACTPARPPRPPSSPGRRRRPARLRRRRPGHPARGAASPSRRSPADRRTIRPDRRVRGDFANVIGQAFAARRSTPAAAPRPTRRPTFLLAQQCADGFFRLVLHADKTRADQTCDGARRAERRRTPTPPRSPCSLSRHAQGDRRPRSRRRRSAVAWLEDAQQATGGFGAGASHRAPNTNSTGLAGWALGTPGRHAGGHAAAAGCAASRSAASRTACYRAAGQASARSPTTTPRVRRRARHRRHHHGDQPTSGARAHAPGAAGAAVGAARADGRDVHGRRAPGQSVELGEHRARSATTRRRQPGERAATSGHAATPSGL